DNRMNFVLSRSRVHGRRGQLEAAAKQLEEATTSAEGDGEAEWLAEVAFRRTEAAWLAGNIDDAIYAARAAVDVVRQVDAWARGALAAWLRRLGVTDVELPELAAPYVREMSGDWAGAAEMWRALGCPYDA